MSKQWGHGFHIGKEEGLESGFETGTNVGESVGGLMVGEQTWHSICAAIEALESNNELRALMLLRTLQHVLAYATGRDTPEQKSGITPPIKQHIKELTK
ncbi:MAG: hypothetical protein H8D87_06385 [Deltaproteobacteria bacterium]|nr:hypothetical protein [Candidatus Desulfobacula maris]